MSRELKFRALDGEDMISPDYVNRNGYAHWIENSIPCGTDLVMQYTGLKDKKGVEIYEGDVVEIFDNEGSAFRYAIQWKHDSYMFAGINTDDWMPIEEFEDCQVIGNIHQNPEML